MEEGGKVEVPYLVGQYTEDYISWASMLTSSAGRGRVRAPVLGCADRCAAAPSMVPSVRHPLAPSAQAPPRPRQGPRISRVAMKVQRP